MATLARGQTFGATEQITAAKLHALVDSGSISGIVNADITNSTITNDKIVSVDGSKLIGLANTPAGSGILPAANLPISVTSYLVPSGFIGMWSGSVATIPSGWYLCDGNNSTPDLRDRFIVGAKQDDGGVAKTNVTGSLTKSGNGTIPSHNHGAGTLTAADESAHTHNINDVAGNELRVGSGSNARLGYSTSTNQGSVGSALWDSEAGSAHGHSVSGTSDTSGTGSTNIAVYYALAFIMKA